MNMKMNLHTHTARCGHATGSDREYVEAAIAAGIRVLGFSDHVPQPYASSYHSHIRMSLPETRDYITSIRSLREEYKQDITIYIGFEAEYYPDLFKSMMKFLSSYEYDYLILGPHFLPDEVTGSYNGDPNSSPEDLRRYVSQTIEGIRTGVFTYVAHPDLFHYTGNDKKLYHDTMEKLCIAAKEADLPLEINLKGLAGGAGYPRADFWSIAKDCGNTIVLGVDAHEPEAFLDTDNFRHADEFVRRLGLKVTETVALADPKRAF